MGAIGGLLGFDSGVAGTSFQGPSKAQLVQPFGQDLTDNTLRASASSMQAQQDLLSALQAQQGIQNQSNVYGQLQNVVAGRGPNPAQAQLAQATGANIQGQAALMAGQRGAGANVGLMARQAAQQGSNIQQQAAGQAATLQAQQSLNALTGAGNLANTMAGQQIGQVNANVTARQAQQGQLLNSISAYNQALAATQGSTNAANAQMAQTQMQGQQSMLGGLMNGAGMGLAMLAAKDGGEVPDINTAAQTPGQIGPSPTGPTQPKSMFGKFLSGFGQKGEQELSDENQPTTGAGQLEKGATQFGAGLGSALGSAFGSDNTDTGLMAGAGEGPSGQMAPSPAEGFSQELGMAAPEMAVAAQGGNVGSKLKSGGHVPGKASVPGNSYKNDTVKALLSPGEVVIPKSVMESKNPAEGAARFVAAVMARKKGKV